MWFRILSLCVLLSSAPRAFSETQASQPQEADALEESTLSPLSDEERSEELAFTQAELQSQLRRAYALDIGPVMPWTRFGLGMLWKAGPSIDAASVGLGDFSFSGNEKSRNYQISLKDQTFAFSKSYRHAGFAPIYLEPFVGYVHWTGDIQPRGEDALNDEIASSLSSSFDIHGVQLGANVGISWIFSSGLFVDYKLMSVSSAVLLQQTYTHNTAEARAKVRELLEGPLSMNTVHLRIGYATLIP